MRERTRSYLHMTPQASASRELGSARGRDDLRRRRSMRQPRMNMTSTMVAIGLLGTFGIVAGCSTGGSTDEVTTDEAALKAASPACASARDACKTKVESIASGIQTACTSRDACKAAFEAAKPELEAAAKDCDTSIKAACVVDIGGNTGGGGRGSFGGGRGSLGGATGHGSLGGGPGSLGGATGHGSFGGGPGHAPDRGLPGHVDSAA